MSSKRSLRRPAARNLGLVTAGALFAAVAGLPATSVAAGKTLYVSASGKAGSAGTSCRTASYTSINAAVAAAAPGSTVIVCAGTYMGQVTVIKPLVLVGEGATVEAFGADNGFLVPVSRVTVEGFTVKGAIGEGILAVSKPGAPVSDVTIKGNLVEGNDLGNPTGGAVSGSKYRSCNATAQPAPAPAIPGDCGEGIHLMSVSHSLVEGNIVVDNSGGIQLSDELGPVDHNTVVGNTVEYNVLDCGITMPSHSSKGFVNGKTVPSAAGVYDNVIERNTVVGNGTTGQGSGILMASPLPGGAVYDNTVEYNTVDVNGQAGITLHSHVPGQDLNGNVVEHNTIGANNLAGDYDFSPHVDAMTTGVVVATAASPVSITVAHNQFAHDTYGIWQTGRVTVSGLSTNAFTAVTTHDFAG